MTGEVTVSGPLTTETIKRIGPSLVVASALGSTLGIVVAQFVDDLGDGILALILGGNAVIYNNRVEITGASSDLVWAGGFLLCLIVGFLALFSYPTARGHGVARLTLLWMVLHLLRQAFVQAVMVPFDADSPLALAYQTLEAPAGLEYVLSAGGAVGLLLVALSAAAAFLAFTPHDKMISTGRKRITFAFWIALVPAIARGVPVHPVFRARRRERGGASPSPDSSDLPGDARCRTRDHRPSTGPKSFVRRPGPGDWAQPWS